MWPILVAVVLAASTNVRATGAEVGPSPAATCVPAWDARGLGPLPWQGIACADMTGDGRFVALGTIAPPGDPHLFLLDDRGQIAEQRSIGARWIVAVAVGEGGSFLAGSCAVPAGTSGDKPLVRVFAGGKELKVDIETPDLQPEHGIYHYADHSNHLPQIFQPVGDKLAVASPNRLTCMALSAEAPAQAADKTKSGAAAGAFGKIGPGTVTRFAVNRDGRAIVALAVRKAERNEQSRGLIALDAAGTSPLWTRPPAEDVDVPPPLEKGPYGPRVSASDDSPVWAPLAVAVDRSGARFASADYQGWNRRFDGGRWDYGIRFLRTRPAVHVYDAEGKEVRRFGPETFAEGFWADLVFSADGKRLLAFGHNWTSRGLGGVGFLPADEKARSLYVLSIDSGDVKILRFPDAISSVAVGDDRTVVGCWDQRVYVLDGELRPIPSLPQGLDVGAAGLVRASRDGSRILAAGADGVVRMLDGSGKELWRNDLNTSAAPADKPWTKNVRLRQPWAADKALGGSGFGIWQRSGVRAHSDLGNQFVVEAPEGLLLIEANGGVAIEQTWAEIRAAGLDPAKVRYVLLTHEHGDHAPAAYLWRLMTGAQVVSTPEIAYAMAHHVPAGMGYGFNPPQPVDVVVEKDQELTLAGLKVRAIRTPGHTSGSLSFAIQREGKTFVALGDLIMPGGGLGYWGSLSFSAEDVLDSLRKLDALRPDGILGGHGLGDPASFIANGIAAGEATGWSKMPPPKPDPHHRVPADYLVVGWLEKIVSAACGDVDGDGLPDVAILTGDGGAATVKVYLNRRGKFEAKPDLVREAAGLAVDKGGRIGLVRAGGAKMADVFLASEPQAVLLLSEEGKFASRQVEWPVRFAVAALADDFNGDGRTDLLIGQRFTGALALALRGADGTFRLAPERAKIAPYYDMQRVDVNHDGRPDLVTTAGDIFLRQADGTLPAAPSLHLNVSSGKEWIGLAAADYNGDGRADLVFTANEEKALKVWIFYNTKDPERPFDDKPAGFSLPEAHVSKDGPAAADWNGDGIADLIVCTPKGAAVLPGSREGLDLKRLAPLKLEYRPHGDAKFVVADFNGDGKMDLAGWGASMVGAAGVYIWLQP